jgi:hypothetical protein
MSEYKEIFLGLGISLYICIFFVATRNIRIALVSLVGFCGLLMIIYYLKRSYRYSQLKEYFWNALTDHDKFAVNYIGFRWPVTKESVKFHPFAFYWKKEAEFQQERNEVIMSYNPVKAEEFIATEKLLCRLTFILLFFVAVVFFSVLAIIN